MQVRNYLGPKVEKIDSKEHEGTFGHLGGGHLLTLIMEVVTQVYRVVKPHRTVYLK